VNELKQMVRMGVKMKDSHWIYQEQDELLRVNPRSQRLMQIDDSGDSGEKGDN
jgi:hypothetical protein